MKKVVFCLVIVLCCSLSISAQESVKLSGSFKVNTMAMSGLTGSAFAQNPTGNLGVVISKGNASASLNLTRDFIDTHSAGNNVIAKMMYTLQQGKFTVNPTFYCVAFDKQMENSLLAPAVSASYMGAMKVEAMIGYGVVFKNPNTIVSSLILSKTSIGNV
jgi:hypothetical protein